MRLLVEIVLDQQQVGQQKITEQELGSEFVGAISGYLESLNRTYRLGVPTELDYEVRLIPSD